MCKIKILFLRVWCQFVKRSVISILRSIQTMSDPITAQPIKYSSFETELIQKIQFKSSSKVSLDAFLFKAFKFFDLLNTGFLAKQEFFRAIAKCGVVVDTHDMDTVFNHYSAPEDKLDYRHFIQQLLFREEEIESASSRPKSSQRNPIDTLENHSQIGVSQSRASQQGESKAKLAQSKMETLKKCGNYDQVLQWMRNQLRQEGLGSLLSLAVKLKSSDTKKTHQVGSQTLQVAAPYLQQSHIDLIFAELSQDRKQIDYSVLIYDIKGTVEEERVKDLQSLFNLLDNRREGEFPITYLISRFLSKAYFDTFKHCVELYCQFQGIDDGVFTQDDFHDCMGFLSIHHSTAASFHNQLVRPFLEEDAKSSASHRSNRSRDFPSNKSQVYQQPHPEPQADFKKNKDSPIVSKMKTEQQQDEEFHSEKKEEKKSVSRFSQVGEVQSDHLQQIESVILRIKKRLASKGTKGFLVFEKVMKNADIDRDTLLNYEQFKQVIKDQRIDITNTQVDMIFNVFDEQGTNLISFPEFMFTLRGKMPENRKELLDRLWNTVKLTEDSTNFAKIKKIVNFRSHPDVQAGRRFQEDIWKEIQDTILTIQELNGAPRSDLISKPEFDQYLENLSLSIIDDKLYESILANFWRVDGSSDISGKYAGSRKVFDTSKNSYLLDHHRNVVKGGSVSQNAPFGTSIQATTYFTEHSKL